MKGKRLIAVLLGFMLVFALLWAAPAMASKTVKVGFVYIMSGPFAAYGQFAKQGAELAEDLKQNQEVQQRYLAV